MNQSSRTRWAAFGVAAALAIGAGNLNAVVAAPVVPINSYEPITPCRLFDTRPAPNTVGLRSTPLGPDSTVTFTVWGTNGQCTIPTVATAVVINLTAVAGATATTFLTAWPADRPQPNASALNVQGGDTVATPNLATVQLSANGAFKLFNKNGDVNVIGDIVGFYRDHHHDDRYFTEDEVDRMVQTEDEPCSTVSGHGRVVAGFSPAGPWVERCMVDRVRTLAGSSGQTGLTDGWGPAARFSSIGSMVVASDGTIFVAEFNHHRIRAIAPDGTVSTLAGSTQGFADGLGTAAQFNSPTGIAIGADGALYVADTVNHRIRRISRTGEVTTFAGSATGGSADGVGTAARFVSPDGITLGPDGNLYVTDFGDSRIRRISPNATVTTVAGDGVAGFADGSGSAARFSGPRGITTAPDGTLLVADQGNHRIRRVTTGGVVTTVVGNGTTAVLETPRRVAVMPDGDIYVSTGSATLRRYRAGQSFQVLSGFGWTAMAITPDGQLMIATTTMVMAVQ